MPDPTEQGASRSAVALRRFNGAATVGWLIMLPVALLTPLKISLPFIVGVSIYANIVGHFSAWIGSRAEVASQTNPPQTAVTDCPACGHRGSSPT